MAWLALAALLARPEPAEPAPRWFNGRILTDDVHHLHLGVRPHVSIDNEGDGASIEYGFAVTVQLTADVL